MREQGATLVVDNRNLGVSATLGDAERLDPLFRPTVSLAHLGRLVSAPAGSRRRLASSQRSFTTVSPRPLRTCRASCIDGALQSRSKSLASWRAYMLRGDLKGCGPNLTRGFEGRSHHPTATIRHCLMLAPNSSSAPRTENPVEALNAANSFTHRGNLFVHQATNASEDASHVRTP
jgi:hypothetical protein